MNTRAGKMRKHAEEVAFFKQHTNVILKTNSIGILTQTLLRRKRNPAQKVRSQKITKGMRAQFNPLACSIYWVFRPTF